MHYEKRIEISGDREKAVEFFRSFFLNSSFELIRNDADVVELKSMGWFRAGNRNPVQLIASARLEKAGDELVFTADVGNLKKMILALAVFILLMEVFFLAVFGIAFSLNGEMSFGHVALISSLPLAPWIFIIPVFWFYFKSRLVSLLDVVANNMAVISQGGQAGPGLD